MTLQIEIVSQEALTPAQQQAIVDLCSLAYQHPFAETLAQFEQRTHVLAWHDNQLVSHALWIPRQLLYNDLPLASAYVEAVATHPEHEGRGYASALLRRLAEAIAPAYQIGALSPSDPAFYSRLGWELWRGPLFMLQNGALVATPDDEAMILRLPQTPAELSLEGRLTAEWREGDVW
jgi:aminoglycoside 2'-N-acetyltransferase I